MSQSQHNFTYDDFSAGDILPLGSKTVSADEIIDFASQFDPQPFHLDEAAGQASVLGGLAASGWHVCAMLMRMMADSFIRNSDSQGSPGLEYVKWLKPVLAGDTLTAKTTILDKRISRSNPELGIIRIQHQIFNQHDVLVSEAQGSIFMGIRAGEQQ